MDHVVEANLHCVNSNIAAEKVDIVQSVTATIAVASAPEVEVQIFEFKGPAWGQHIFDANAERPSGQAMVGIMMVRLEDYVPPTNRVSLASSDGAHHAKPPFA